jgi:RNA polymerase sigma-70 factor (ECF subfamily)
VALRQEEFTLCDDVDVDRDRILVERCQAGDTGAFGSLYTRYYERLLRFCLRRLHDRHEAEDAAQEAFARAWKALPKFAGERRFYPWLTVIAGNICTDTLRRRSRSTPTDDVDLGARLPIGASANVSADELLIASVDGELVHKALDHLSVRHREVLAMREGSGWTYQQIADHEGVEIGTIETLLWRARQALKREFNVLSESKGALAGFFLGAGTAIRTGLMRVARRTAALQASGGAGTGSGTIRNAFAGAAVTSAAVAAAFIAPHAFDASHHAGQVALPAPAAVVQTLGSASRLASVTPRGTARSAGVSPLSAVADGTGIGGSDGSSATAGSTGSGASTFLPASTAATSLAHGTASTLAKGGLTGAVTQSPLPQELLQGLTTGISNAAASSTVPSVVPSTVDAATSTVDGLAAALGLSIGSSESPAGSNSASAVPVTTTTLPALATTSAATTTVTSTVTPTLQKLLGQG